jgi:hypothetical protein
LLAWKALFFSYRFFNNKEIGLTLSTALELYPVSLNDIVLDSVSASGLVIEYGIINGYGSSGEIKLSYFDQDPFEPRYYMFGR